MTEHDTVASNNRTITRVLMVIGIILTVLAGGVGVAIQNRLPLAQWGLAIVAERLGFEGVHFRLERLDMDGAVVSDLILGPDVSIAALDVNYSFFDLIDGHVQRVMLSDASVVISNPDDGFLGHLQQIIRSGSTEESSTTTVILPEIEVRNLGVVGSLNGAELAITVDGDISPDLTGDFRAIGNAGYAIGERALKANNISVAALLGDGARSVSFTSLRADISDSGTEFWFAPLRLSGTADYSGSAINYSLSAVGSNNRLTTALNGTADIDTLSAQARLTISDITFSPQDLQPSDLSALATLPSPVSGTIGGHADIVWENGAPQITTSMTLKDGAGGFTNFTAKQIEARISGEWHGSNTQATVSAKIPNAVIGTGDISVGLTSAMIDAEVHPTSGAVTVSAPSLHLRHLAPPSEFLFPPLRISGDGKFQKPGAELSLSVNALDDRLSVTVSGTGDIDKQFSTARLSLSPMTFGKDGIRLDQISSLLKTPVKASGTIEGFADLSVNNGVPAVSAEINLTGGSGSFDKASIQDASARIKGNWPDKNGRALLFATLSNPVISHDNNTVLIPSAKFDATVDPVSMAATLNITDLHLRHLAVDPMVKPLRLSGDGQLENSKIDFDMTAVLDTPPPSQKLIAVSGSHNLKNRDGRAKVSVGNFYFDPAALKPSDISPLLSGLPAITGAVSAEADAIWTPSIITTSGHLNLTNLSAKTDTVSVNNINTNLFLSDIWPPQTDKPQTIKIDQIASTISLNAPRLSFSILDQVSTSTSNPIPSVLLHNLNAGFIGGELSINNLRFDPDNTEHDLAVKLKHIDLEKLFSLIELQGVAGTGTISGTVPLLVRKNDVEIKDGLLKADGPGVLQFRSQQAKQALSGGGKQVDLLLRVLDDFRYSDLSLTIGRERSGSALIQLKLSGHNPAVMDGHTFNLNINLEGNADNLIAALLEAFRLSDSAIRATVGSAQQ
jgi:hypothetical protein